MQKETLRPLIAKLRAVSIQETNVCNIDTGH
jgi:hypothetical protein